MLFLCLITVAYTASIILKPSISTTYFTILPFIIIRAFTPKVILVTSIFFYFLIIKHCLPPGICIHRTLLLHFVWCKTLLYLLCFLVAHNLHKLIPYHHSLFIYFPFLILLFMLEKYYDKMSIVKFMIH